ncbi:MAG TPA: hypothetical protein VGH20_07225 [Myxococcales bacterium]|jgi:hypothetical protein
MPVNEKAVGVLRQPFLDTSGPLTIDVAANFDGFVLVQLMSKKSGPPPEKFPRGTTPPWFEIVLAARQKVSVELQSKMAFVVDVEEGFAATPDNVWSFARQYMLLMGMEPPPPKGKGVKFLTLPGDCPIVT